jgi:hypothetical protein
MSTVFNFANAVVNHAKNGFKTTDEISLSDRLSICNSCNKNKNGTCQECGCIISIKTSWASEKCPLDKWQCV